MGLSHFSKTVNAPEHKQHVVPSHLKQEEDWIQILKKKDKLYEHLQFRSEVNDLGEPIPYDQMQPVKQALIVEKLRQQLSQIIKNQQSINPQIKQQMFEKIAYKAQMIKRK